MIVSSKAYYGCSECFSYWGTTHEAEAWDNPDAFIGRMEYHAESSCPKCATTGTKFPLYEKCIGCAQTEERWSLLDVDSYRCSICRSEHLTRLFYPGIMIAGLVLAGVIRNLTM